MNLEYSRKISDCLRNKPVKRAYLFGSAAREEENEQSDIDILVELDYSQPIGLGFVRMKLELEDLLKKKVDIVSDLSVSKHIRPFIDAEKILIYER